MKKVKRFILFLTIIVCIFTLSVSAKSSSVTTGVEELIPEWAEEDSEVLKEAAGPGALLYELLMAFKGGTGPALKFFLLAFGLSLCLVSVSSFDSEAMKNASLGASFISGALLLTSLYPILYGATEALNSMNSFFSSLGAVMSSITLAGGGVGTAAVQAGAVGFTLSITSLFGERLLISLSVLILTLGLFSAFGGGSVSSLLKFLRSFFLWGVGVISAILGAALSLQTVISSAQDSVAMRTAKYAVSGMLPVVSQAVSGALSTLAAGVSYAKGVVGISAVFILLSTALSPLLILLLYKLSLSLCAGFMEMCSARSGARVYSSLKSGLDCIIAVYSLMTVIYILQVVIFMKSGVAIA